MTQPPSAEPVNLVAAAHARERALIDSMTDEQARAASLLPGWTRGHVLAARLAFGRAVNRQIASTLADQRVELFDGGREGRDAAIEANAYRPVQELVPEVQQELIAVDKSWAGLGRADWSRPITYREEGTLLSLLLACWRESEIHCVDLDLGVRPSGWTPQFCRHLFQFLTPRVPEGLEVELITPDGEAVVLGSGERIQIRGALTDLAAWLAGRPPDGPVESSTGTLPELQRLRQVRSQR